MNIFKHVFHFYKLSTDLPIFYQFYTSSFVYTSTPLMLFFIIRIHQKFDSPFKNSTVTVEPLSNYLNTKLTMFS